MAQHLYDAYLDWDTRNALGVKPVQETIDRIKAFSLLDELTALCCGPDVSVERFFSFGAGKDFNDSETYLLAVSPTGLYLGDPAEYAQRTEQSRRYEAAYRAAAKLFPKFSYSAAEAEAMMDRAFALETELAGGMMTSAEDHRYVRLLSQKKSFRSCWRSRTLQLFSASAKIRRTASSTQAFTRSLIQPHSLRPGIKAAASTSRHN